MLSLRPITAEQRKPREDPCVQGETRFVNRKRHRVLKEAADKQSSEICFPNARRRKEEQLTTSWKSKRIAPAGQMATLQVYHRLVVCHVRLVKLMFYSSFCTINESMSSMENNLYLELSARQVNYLWENRQMCIYILNTSTMSIKPQCFTWGRLSCTVSQVNYFRLWDILPFDFNLCKWFFCQIEMMT